jgi:hypothetical protein
MTTLVKLRGPFAVAIGALLVAGAGSARFLAAGQGRGPSVAPPYIVEWVYRVKWGHKEEFFQLFKKYQVPVLEREKQLGYVNQYTIYSPSLHTSEDGRWDYRVIIEYKDQASSGHGNELTKQLFPDQATLKREENRRWEITEVHWDLPIHVVDPKADE